MASVEIDLTRVTDWDSFHDEFARVMGFPDFYGRNMNAWEDCMSDLSKPDAVGMTSVQVPRGEDLILILKGAIEFRTRLPEVFAALHDSTAHVNRVKVAIPGSTRLLLLPV
jgi:RNAse (barnase) inhibitor barstar